MATERTQIIEDLDELLSTFTEIDNGFRNLKDSLFDKRRTIPYPVKEDIDVLINKTIMSRQFAIQSGIEVAKRREVRAYNVTKRMRHIIKSLNSSRMFLIMDLFLARRPCWIMKSKLERTLLFLLILKTKKKLFSESK